LVLEKVERVRTVAPLSHRVGTFAKQLKILHLGGFTDEEKSHFREVIFENVNYSLRSLLEAAQTKDITLDSENQEAADAFLQSTNIHLDEEVMHRPLHG
jgi:hypothetical protein